MRTSKIWANNGKCPLQLFLGLVIRKEPGVATTLNVNKLRETSFMKHLKGLFWSKERNTKN